ncbi:type VI secretion system ImpA family N-terminal domain-containing protein [Duganella callida]|uniref:Type VI secretion system protein TssA n=1 Tax=Duganella callida TaxID=2561932 RepID=A0A4Y9RY56_9BURK|nr:type VI secretion system ImpA family N-terminal domain-containing protein [Duganella callida]TFW13902.1 type VI secretion system protein TssA [Duganella callida]
MFNVERLLQPVGGEDLSFSGEVDAIAQARQYDDPALDQGAWEAALKEADWPFVASRCADLIATRSKDLRLGVWLAEALAKTSGLRGLGDGFAVLAGLCDRHWRDLYPPADDGDFDQRTGNLHWLLTRTPALVRECAAPSLEDAEYCCAGLQALERVVDMQLGASGPGFGAARDALQSLIRSLAPQSALAPPPASGDMPVVAAAMLSGVALQTRAQALQQLRLVADFFRRTEPHSPVTYLAERAASWGDMPLHVWLRAVIKDPAAIAGVEELLGTFSARE